MPADPRGTEAHSAEEVLSGTPAFEVDRFMARRLRAYKAVIGELGHTADALSQAAEPVPVLLRTLTRCIAACCATSGVLYLTEPERLSVVSSLGIANASGNEVAAWSEHLELFQRAIRLREPVLIPEAGLESFSKELLARVGCSFAVIVPVLGVGAEFGALALCGCDGCVQERNRRDA
jgi:hypothetical protein